MPYFYGAMHLCYTRMTWIKAEINEDTNEFVERIQSQNDCSKPEAVAILLRDAKRRRTANVEQ